MTSRTLKAAPTVSVIMAVYNGGRYLRQAVDSILAQTLDDWEFVIVDDGSSDDTPQILASYRDPRLVRLSNGQNLGLTRSLNRGIGASSGLYLARQDADDWSLPQRLERQVAYMEAHPQVGLLGTGSRWVDGRGSLLRDWQPETDPMAIQQMLLGAIPFLHGTFFFRRACLPDIGGGYDETMRVAQDCDLLLRLSERWELANLPEILYVHRLHENTVTAQREGEQAACLQRARQAAIRRRLSYGWARIGLSRDALPPWVRQANRRWLARRYVWWSAGARVVSRRVALQLLLIGFLLDPTTPELWSYVQGIVRRKASGWYRWMTSPTSGLL